MTYSLKTQIAEVERELTMRRSVYPRQVAARKIRPAVAQLQIGIMESVLETLTRLQQQERQSHDHDHAT